MTHRFHSRASAIGARLAALALIGALASLLAPSAATAQRTDRRATLAELDRYIPKALAEWNGAGVAVGIVENDSLVYARGFGVREVGKADPVDAATVFAIGSNTKFFTAVAAAMLADDGVLSLDDRITRFLPQFQLYDPWVTREFTLRDAMSHRSGLGRRGDALWHGTPLSRDEIVRRVRYLVPSSSFRSEYGYQNIMFLTAGQTIAAATGKSWDDVIRDRIFQPLGMVASNTSVKQLAGRPNVASPHNLAPGETRPVQIPWMDIDNIAPAGSINSNVQDMARWMRFILGGGTAGGRQLVKQSTLADITGPHSIATRVVADTLNPTRHFSLYGLGIGISDLHGVKVLQHTGGIDGMLSFVAMVPERNLGIVVLTNVAGHNALYTAVGSRILNDFLGGPTRDWSAIALQQTRRAEEEAAKRAQARYAARVVDAKPSRALGEYAGIYRHEMYGDATITLEDGTLRLRYPAAVDVRLRHLHYDTFLGGAPSTPPDSPDGAVVRFALDARGRVASVDVEGIAEFARVRDTEAGAR
ncbi:MAG: serine hydrolase [Gemmatimonadaceae bacterium]|nr:serine hydrolase [Gemmatimonadaceae bacterium]